MEFDEIGSDELKAMLRDTMHEVREFNRIIKAHSEMLTRLLRIDQERTPLALDVANSDNARGQALGILQTAQMLSARLDLIDFETNPAAFESEPRVSSSVFGKFDKARKMLGPRARGRGVRIKLEGQSHKKVDLFPVFDIVPFLVLENAVKYSPRDGEITITVTELAQHIEARVESLGPLVQPDELPSLFIKGFRGVEAKKVSEKGSGIGLHFAKFASEVNGSTLTVSSGPHVCSYNAVRYSHFCVVLLVPSVS